jgi:hypothetical protein
MKLEETFTVKFDGSEDLKAAIRLLIQGNIFGGDILDALTGASVRKKFEAKIQILADEAYEEAGGYENGYEASQEIWQQAWQNLEKNLISQILQKTIKDEYL